MEVTVRQIGIFMWNVRDRLISLKSMQRACTICTLIVSLAGCLALKNPATSDNPSDSDMLVIGVPNWQVGNYGNNSERPGQNTLLNPRQILKIGNRYLVVDGGNNRILVFEGAISETPSYVLGQTDFSSGWRSNNGSGGGSVTASGFNGVIQIASNGTKLVASDASNNRVLIWNSIPTSSYQPADVVIGQTNMTSGEFNQGNPSPSASSLSFPAGVLLIGSKLLIADSGNNRVLIYNTIPTTHGASADLVIGQADFVSGSTNRGAGSPSAISLNGPRFLSSDGTKLIVADPSNHRVLIWNTVPNTLDDDADLVLGQAAFNTNTGATTQTGLKTPYHALVLGSALYIADGGNHRVVYHADLSTLTSNQAATGIFGQATFTAGSINRTGSTTAPTANGFYYPYQLSSVDSALWVTDPNNHRLLKFNTPPTPTSEAQGDLVAADSVWGQSSLTVNNPNRIATPNNSGFKKITGACVFEERLVVVDRDNNRALVFDRNHLKNGPLWVIGQMDFSSGSVNQGGITAANTFNFNNAETTCAYDSRGRLYISDPGNNRVLVWTQTPTANGTGANFVLGQAGNFTTSADNGCAAQALKWPSGLTMANDRLIVNDYGHSRSLVFDVSGGTLDDTADVAIGQPDLTTCAGGITQTVSSGPWASHWDGTRLYISEALANRIMVYNSVPTTHGVPANYVIGQPDFTSNLNGLTANRFGFGTTIGMRTTPAMVDNYLLVSDYENSRVLAFDLSQLANNMSASHVFGQPDLTTEETPGYGSCLYGNSSNTAFRCFMGTHSIHAFTDDGFVYFTDRARLIRVKRSKLWNYVRQ